MRVYKSTSLPDAVPTVHCVVCRDGQLVGFLNRKSDSEPRAIVVQKGPLYLQGAATTRYLASEQIRTMGHR
jgi:hypothetical protein